MRLIQWLLNLLYPPKCVFCTGLLTDEETDLCGHCRRSIPRLEQPVKRGSFFEECHSLYHYENEVAEAVKRFKFRGREHYAACFGSLMAMELLRRNVEFDYITWAPVSRRRRRKRGYDQGQLLAKRIAQELQVPWGRALEKVRDNPPQSTRTDTAARQGNVINVYRAVDAESWKGKRVLVVDDVITSGATLSECCRVLKTAGADSLVCCSFAAAKKQ